MNSTSPSADPRTAARPAVRPARPWSFPAVREATLDQGLRALTYHLSGQHVLSLRLAIPLPLACEPAGREGVGALMARTLDEGTAALSPRRMAELLERRGVAFDAGVGERGLVIDLDVPGRHFADALDLLAQALIEPAFGEDEVRRHLRTRLADIDQERASAGQRAAIEFIAAYYPQESRLSRPTAGDRASIGSMTGVDIADYHRRYIGPAGSTVVVAGDIAGLDVVGELQRGLNGWVEPATRRGPMDPPESRRDEAGWGIVLVDRPGAVQSELYLGCPGPGRESATGWAPYPVLAFLVGGAPQARLDARLREDLGYTYGMRCGFRPRVGAGLFVASGAVRADVTAPALTETLDILHSARDGFTPEETRAGVDFLCETAPGRYASADAIADEAVGRALEGLDTDHTTRALAAMRQLTPDALQRAYRRFIGDDMRQWTIVVVGDAASVQAPLQALADDRGLGTVRVVSSS